MFRRIDDLFLHVIVGHDREWKASQTRILQTGEVKDFHCVYCGYDYETIGQLHSHHRWAIFASYLCIVISFSSETAIGARYKSSAISFIATSASRLQTN